MACRFSPPPRAIPRPISIFAYYDLLRVPVPAEGRSEATRLTEAGFSYYDPEPSPDGRLIALRRLPDDRPLAAGARIAVLSSDGRLTSSGDTSMPRDLTAETDLSVEQHRWLPDGGGLLYTAGWRGEQAVHYVALSPGAGSIEDDGRWTMDDSSSRLSSSIVYRPSSGQDRQRFRPIIVSSAISTSAPMAAWPLWPARRIIPAICFCAGRMARSYSSRRSTIRCLPNA